MEEMKGIAHIQIHVGKLDEYKRLGHKCIDIVRTQDTGTLQYEIAINEDEMTAVVFERYRDSEAGLIHGKNVEDVSKELSKICEISGEVWGNPSPKLRTMLQSANVTIYKPFAAA